MSARPKVLLVEDEMLVAMLAAEWLREFGFDVVEATTASQALEHARADPATFVAAVIDLGLPDRPGDALAVDLRALRPDLPIIIASGQGASRAGGIGAERVRVLDKPYESETLRRKLIELGLLTA